MNEYDAGEIAYKNGYELGLKIGQDEYVEQFIKGFLKAREEIGTTINKERKKKRKYYRKCGVCGERYEQSEMIRTNQSPNGWLCFDCCNVEHPEYEDFGEY